MKGLALILAMASTMLLGCSRSEDPAKPGQKPEPSVGEQVIDGVTGRAAVRSYLDTKETIKDIQIKQKERNQKIP